jgi:hypothetical protein
MQNNREIEQTSKKDGLYLHGGKKHQKDLL